MYSHTWVFFMHALQMCAAVQAEIVHRNFGRFDVIKTGKMVTQYCKK